LSRKPSGIKRQKNLRLHDFRAITILGLDSPDEIAAIGQRFDGMADEQHADHASGLVPRHKITGGNLTDPAAFSGRLT
jgi:hypothetical protein